MTTLFWDIDGTLLSTSRAGIAAWEGALSEIAGVTRSLERLHTAGLTDVEIAGLLLEQADVDRARTDPLLRAYENRLAGVLGRRQGRVMPKVHEILGGLAGREDVRMLLLTGNTRRGADAKLRHYGLAEFFRIGAFADDAPDRPGVARAALAAARTHFGEVDLERAYVIGDTPADIVCGQAIGACTIAVATGPYGLQELEGHAPSHAFAELPSLDRFAATVGVDL